MFRIIKISIPSVLLLVTLPILANSSFGPVKVKSVSVSDANMLVVNIQSDGTNKHTEQCDVGRKNSLIINKNSPYQKEMFAIALAAKASGKSITGWVNGCHSYWNYKAPKMTVISLVE